MRATVDSGGARNFRLPRSTHRRAAGLQKSSYVVNTNVIFCSLSEADAARV